MPLQSVSFLDKIGYIANYIWGRLNLDILWTWLPSDIRFWIGTFIGIMFILAIKRVIIT